MWPVLLLRLRLDQSLHSARAAGAKVDVVGRWKRRRLAVERDFVQAPARVSLFTLSQLPFLPNKKGGFRARGWPEAGVQAARGRLQRDQLGRLMCVLF